MKKGTKANAIDDLGKFDGSKMTIKVDGKQIYPQKRYSIVRVDNKCPLNIEDDFYCSAYMQKDKCKKCKEFRGDTKEQLERKIAQVLFRQEIRLYKKFWGGNMSNIVKKNQYKWCLETAEEIVEFLGVE